MTEQETWKDIPGFEGHYQVSDKGRVKSFKKSKDGMVLSVKNKKGWYLSVILCHGGRRITMRVHVLVAKVFVPNPDNKPEVNHKDTNKQNNVATNLEWATRKENHDHAVANVPSMLSGMVAHNKILRPKIVQQVSPDGRILGEFPTAKQAGKVTGVCKRNILQVANHTEYKPGKTRKQAGGFIWRFKDAV